MPLSPGTRNELMPRKLVLSAEARKLWTEGVHDYIEPRLKVGGELESVRGLANKVPEHAARIAAVLTLVSDIKAGEVSAAAMTSGIEIVQHYLIEALRLWGASAVSEALHQAQRLLTWLHTSWAHPVVSLPDIYQRGPSAIRDKASAHSAVTILSDHGWLVSASGCEIDGVFRREIWRIIKG